MLDHIPRWTVHPLTLDKSSRKRSRCMRQFTLGKKFIQKTGTRLPACGRDQASLASAGPCPFSVSPCQRSSDDFDVAVRRFDCGAGKPGLQAGR